MGSMLPLLRIDVCVTAHLYRCYFLPRMSTIVEYRILVTFAQIAPR